MKKTLLVLILAILVCLSACGKSSGTASTTDTTAPTTTPGTTQPESKPTDPSEPDEYKFEPGYFPIPTEPATFTFSNGVAGWSTILEINTDGTFYGSYTDLEMGIAGDGYDATCYVCEFSGVFTDVEKIDKYSYKVHLIDFATDEPEGKEWIEDNIRYVVSVPSGMTVPKESLPCDEFIVYMPNTPVEQLSEEFLFWWPYNNQGKTTLECFGMRNSLTNDGFFYIPE